MSVFYVMRECEFVFLFMYVCSRSKNAIWHSSADVTWHKSVDRWTPEFCITNKYKEFNKIRTEVHSIL